MLNIRDTNGNFIKIPVIKGDKGDTPVKGTDYFTDEDKSQIANQAKDLIPMSDYILKNQGSANTGKILVVGADGNIALTDMPNNISGDVIGNIDGNNNIIITGDLLDGTYIFKYENDGSYAEIGTLVVGGVVQYSITSTLTNCIATSSNTNVINEGGTATLTFTANEGYTLPETIVVSGATYTWDSAIGTLILSEPTSDITINIVAVEDESGYTNIIDTIGYSDNNRISLSSGDLSALDGYVTTGMIDMSVYEKPCIIRTQGVNFTQGNCNFAIYQADGTKITTTTISNIIDLSSSDSNFNSFVVTTDDSGNLTITNSGVFNYIKICGFGSGANLIITINEEITD